MRSIFLVSALLVACSGETSDVTSDDGTSDTVNPQESADTGVPDGPCATVAPSVEIGTGLFSFEEVAEGDNLTMVEGSQGGWHLTSGARVIGMGPLVSYIGSIRVVSTNEVAGSPADPLTTIDLSKPGLATWDADTCEGAFYNIQVRLDDLEVPKGQSVVATICALHRSSLELSMTVTDLETGVSASDTLVVTGLLDPVTNCP